MRVLITGGGGFVGSSLAKQFIREGYEVFIIDNFSTGRSTNLEGISNEYIFDCDLTDPKSIPILEQILAYVDIVYHFAASIGVKLVQEKPKETFLNSTKINDNLFPLFEKHQVKVVFSSTSEVYGETKNLQGSKETDHLEIHPVQKPRGSYACSKLFSEFMIRSYTFPSVIIRFFNIVGPDQVPDYGHVLPRFIERAMRNEPLQVYGDGEQIRSFCDIRDAVEMLMIMVGTVHNGEIYNIGNDATVYTMNELAETVIDVLGSDSEIMHIPLEKAFGNQFEEIYVRHPNTNKIKRFYECKHNLEDIIRNIYEKNFDRSSAS